MDFVEVILDRIYFSIYKFVSTSTNNLVKITL